MRNLLTVGLMLAGMLLGGAAGASGWTFFPDPSRPGQANWANEVKPARNATALPTTAAAFANPAPVSGVFLTGAIVRDYTSGTEMTCFSMANGGMVNGSLVVLMNRFKYIMATELEKAGLDTIDKLGDRVVWAVGKCMPDLLDEPVKPETLTLYVPPNRLTALPFPLDGLNLELRADSGGEFIPVISKR